MLASALFARDILYGRVDCADLALLLRFKEVPYSRRRNTGLLQRTKYDRFEPVNNAIINFYIVTGLVFVAALSGKRFGHRCLQ
jgi:hypothetical protein